MILVEAKVIDSTHLELSKPIAEREGRILIVSVAEAADMDIERKQWLDASNNALQMAYGDTEPDYSTSMVRDRNPDYRA